LDEYKKELDKAPTPEEVKACEDDQLGKAGQKGTNCE